MHCTSCGEPTSVKGDMIAWGDDEHVHTGSCHQRLILADDRLDIERRLWAALTLFDMRQAPLVKVTVTGADILGVIVDHIHTAFVLEDQTGTPHIFTPEGVAISVEEDAFAA